MNLLVHNVIEREIEREKVQMKPPIEMKAFERARMLAFGGLFVVVAQWPFLCDIIQKA